jgi:hypothetical protein
MLGEIKINGGLAMGGKVREKRPFCHARHEMEQLNAARIYDIRSAGQRLGVSSGFRSL